MKLSGKVAIVTGSTSGIGRAIAVLFASEGAKVTLAGRSSERLAEVERDVKSTVGQCIGILADLSKLPEIDKVVEGTIKEFGKVDILVNCAGIWELANFLEISEDFYDRTMNINLKSVFFMCQRAASEMIKQGRGKIINFSSIAGGQLGWSTASVYCVSKGGVASLTQALAAELGPYHINVNAISPGEIRTPMNESDLADPDYLKMMLNMTHRWVESEKPKISSMLLCT